MSLIYIIEDEPIMADCIAAAIAGVATEPNDIAVFNDAVSAMEAVNERVPDVILLDIMLTGPNGFTFLNEMISYPDTAKVPVVLISSLDLSKRNLEHYGVTQVLDKAKMTPDDIYAAIQAALSGASQSIIDTAIATSNPEFTPATPLLPESTASEPSDAPMAMPATQPVNPPINLDDFKQRLADSANQDPDA